MNLVFSKVLIGDAIDCLRTLRDSSVDCCITSPPYYGLRDYGVSGQIGLEDTPEEYIERLVSVFREVHRVLKEDGTFWVNMGDCYCNSNGYIRASEQFRRDVRDSSPANDRDLTALHVAGYKTKDLMGIPWMLAFALRTDGWYLRQDIILEKTNPMPESVTDRCTKSHEYIFMLSKSPQYYYDNEAIQEDAVCDVSDEQSIRFGGNKYGDDTSNCSQTKSGNVYVPNGKRNKRDVWTVSIASYKDAHFATFPPKLVEPMVFAGCRPGGTVLDCFAGSGTTLAVANYYGRNAIGCELNPKYENMIVNRIEDMCGRLVSDISITIAP